MIPKSNTKIFIDKLKLFLDLRGFEDLLERRNLDNIDRKLGCFFRRTCKFIQVREALAMVNSKL